MIINIFNQAPILLRQRIRIQKFKSLIKDRTAGFVGRDFIIKAVDDLIGSASFRSGYIIIRGEPGIGKTALLAELVKRRGYVHHFNIAPENIVSTEDFLNNLCSQLIVRYQLPYPDLPAEALKDNGFLSELLEAIAEQEANLPLVILIDALDEAADLGLPPEANRLFLPQSLPENVYIVATSRDELDFRLNVQHREDIYLRDDDPQNLLDVRHYIENFIAAHPVEMQARIRQWTVDQDGVLVALDEAGFAQILTDRSQGNFMYLVYVMHDILNDKITAGNNDQIKNLPLGLRAYYQRHWRQMRDLDQTRFENYYQPVVCLLATVREPVALAELVQWTKLSPLVIKEVIDAWLEFLNVSEDAEGTDRYRVYHASFQDFLQDAVGLKQYHDQIALSALNKIPGFQQDS